jgi:hypothetical protein
MTGSATQMEHEEGLVRGFVVPYRQERMIDFLRNSKRRGQILMTLSHFRALDGRFAKRAPQPQTASSILRLLQSRGAPTHCYLVSENMSLDGRTMSLEAALDAIVGMGMGTLLSCIPGRLGYFEGEIPGRRFLLERPAA